MKDGYGFIQCADREARMFFHFSEFMDPEYIPEDKAEVQFTVLPVSSFVTTVLCVGQWGILLLLLTVLPVRNFLVQFIVLRDFATTPVYCAVSKEFG